MDDKLTDEAYGRAFALAGDALDRAWAQADLEGLAMSARAALNLEAYREEPSVIEAAGRFVADELPDRADDPAVLGFALWSQAIAHVYDDARCVEEELHFNGDIVTGFYDFVSGPEWRAFEASLGHGGDLGESCAMWTGACEQADGRHPTSFTEIYARAETFAQDAFDRAWPADCEGIATYTEAAYCLSNAEDKMLKAARRYVARELPDRVDDPVVLGFAMWCQALSRVRGVQRFVDEHFWDVAANFACAAYNSDWNYFKKSVAEYGFDGAEHLDLSDELDEHLLSSRPAQQAVYNLQFAYDDILTEGQAAAVMRSFAAGGPNLDSQHLFSTVHRHVLQGPMRVDADRIAGLHGCRVLETCGDRALLVLPPAVSYRNYDLVFAEGYDPETEGWSSWKHTDLLTGIYKLHSSNLINLNGGIARMVWTRADVAREFEDWVGRAPTDEEVDDVVDRLGDHLELAAAQYGEDILYDAAAYVVRHNVRPSATLDEPATSSGHPMGMEAHVRDTTAESVAGYRLLEERRDRAVLFSPYADDPAPYVVVEGYDSETGSCSSGFHTADPIEALDEFYDASFIDRYDPEVVAYVVWECWDVEDRVGRFLPERDEIRVIVDPDYKDDYEDDFQEKYLATCDRFKTHLEDELPGLCRGIITGAIDDVVLGGLGLDAANQTRGFRTDRDEREER